MDINKVFISAFADEAAEKFEEQIKVLKTNGLKGLEIRGVDGVGISAISETRAKELKKILDDNGIEVWSIGSPIGKTKITDNFNTELNTFKKLLDIAAILECENFRLFSFYGTNGETKFFDEVLFRLNEFVSIAKSYNIFIGHENEKDIYGDTIERCVQIHENIPDLFSIFDPANFIQCKQNTLEAWQKLKKYVKYIHIKDARISDNNVVPAGCGDGHIKEILTDYFSMNKYNITIEPHLQAFTGLNDLEGDNNQSIVGQSEFKFDDNVSAFNSAVSYLKKILEEIKL